MSCTLLNALPQNGSMSCTLPKGIMRQSCRVARIVEEDLGAMGNTRPKGEIAKGSQDKRQEGGGKRRYGHKSLPNGLRVYPSTSRLSHTQCPDTSRVRRLVWQDSGRWRHVARWSPATSTTAAIGRVSCSTPIKHTSGWDCHNWVQDALEAICTKNWITASTPSSAIATMMEAVNG